MNLNEPITLQDVRMLAKQSIYPVFVCKKLFASIFIPVRAAFVSIPDLIAL
jgi:hypothetical protein